MSVLGVEPKSDSETIQRAYAKLAQKYHPNNADDGQCRDVRSASTRPMRHSSDPELRGIFDKLKGVGQEEGGPKFSGFQFFDALGREARRRAAILCVLYDRRLSKPTAPSLSMRHLELIVEATAAELEFGAMVFETARPGGERRQEQPANHRGRNGFSGEQEATGRGCDGIHKRNGNRGRSPSKPKRPESNGGQRTERGAGAEFCLIRFRNDDAAVHRFASDDAFAGAVDIRRPAGCSGPWL